MPRKYRTKRKPTRRRRRKRRSYIPRAPFPDRALRKLRYSELYSFDPGVSSIATYDILANGIYDPYQGIGGTHAYGFDQMMVAYDHFVVLGSKIRVEFTNALDTNSALFAAIKLSDGPTFPTVVNQILQEPKTKHITIGNAYSGKANPTLTHTYSAKKFFSTKDVIGNDNLQGNVSGDPSEKAHFLVSVAGMNPADDCSPVPAIITVDYIVMFIEPKAVPLST